MKDKVSLQISIFYTSQSNLIIIYSLLVIAQIVYDLIPLSSNNSNNEAVHQQKNASFLNTTFGFITIIIAAIILVILSLLLCIALKYIDPKSSATVKVKIYLSFE